jgi:two-component system OmpR family response regulator
MITAQETEVEMKNILLVEGSLENADIIEQSFKKTKYCIRRITPAELNLQTLQYFDCHLIILETGSDKDTSLQCLSMLQEFAFQIPILVLSNEEVIPEVIPHLTFKEHDFLLKPVTAFELKTRAKRLMAKADPKADTFSLKSAGIILDLISRQAYRGTQAIPLQNNEFELLEFLMRNAGRVITKEQILEKIWNYTFDPQTNIVDVLVSRLRSKIDREFSVKVIRTIRGVGYSFVLA